jgi:hypothetical protein
MRKIVVTLTAVLTVAGLVVYLVRPGSSRQVVLNKKTQNSGGAGPLVSLDKVDHSVWDGLLKKRVDANGMVDYAGWKSSESDTDALKQYLVTLGRGDAEGSDAIDGKLAFWINAYNALTVYGILQVYPTSSIRNHTAKVVGYNIWHDLLLPVADQQYSLDAIEHKILRMLGEPRIHFAIVCASIGCPRLRNEAYTSQKLEKQLADNTRDFFSRQRNLQADLNRRQLRVSSILDWFGEDFGPTPQKALARLANYMPNDATRRLVEQGDFSVDYLDYDWNLNNQREPPVPIEPPLLGAGVSAKQLRSAGTNKTNAPARKPACPTGRS